MKINSGMFRGIDPTVTLISKVLIIGFVIVCAILAEEAGALFTQVSAAILYNFKWFYLITASAILVFLLYLMVSRYGNIKLGTDDEKPEFSLGSWLSMLFSAGMGIGLLFWSVAEPMWHYAGNPFSETPLSNESAQTAIRLSFFHWGLHPWALYIMTALGLAYFSYRKGKPLTIRSALIPLFGEKRLDGWLGNTIDILIVTITAFGIATSFGLGVIQMSTGMELLFGVKITIASQIIMITIISFIAILSVISGVGKGIKILSVWNMILSAVILAGVLLFGPTRYILHIYLEGTADYLQNVIGLSLWSDTQEDSQWQNWWTAFYWAWWLTWAPFVGMFIARISRGRTIRELIGGALIVPTLFGFLWIATLGGAAMHYENEDKQNHQTQVTEQQLTGEAAAFTGGDILTATKADSTQAIFTLFEKIEIDSGVNIATIFSALATFLLVTYFVTSADSGTLVLCTLSSHGSLEPPRASRIIWGLTVGIIAAGLLWAGGLKTVQTATICAALPAAFLVIMMALSIHKALRKEVVHAINS
ncbi:BCCT family transporter [Marinomonas algicola]|uniref:BCCT family transporter n=1 Tax=Marinomonas algicola TaxID=2773454 RepID=UPI00174DE3A5|nr:BCCT family transporter [Marinomonas algicola]